MTNAQNEPYQRVVHYDSEKHGFWDGFGRDLNPLCGQPEWILVSDMKEAVDCAKCRQKLSR